MIRNPLHSAVGRTRPDLNRVAEGIAASLRQFSISAQRAAEGNGNGNGNDNPNNNYNNNNNYNYNRSPPTPGPTNRQRAAAAAVDELLASVTGSNNGFSKTPPLRYYNPASLNRSPAATAAAAAAAPGGQGQGQAQAQAPGQGPNIITLKTPPRGGFAGAGRPFPGGGNFQSQTQSGNNGGAGVGGAGGANGPLGGPRIIRGGFRGRGGTFAPRNVGGRQGGGVGGGSFGPGRGGGRRDDRPQRARRGRRRSGGRDEDRGGRRRQREEEEEEEGGGGLLTLHPRVRAYLEEKEIGQTTAFRPSVSLESLAGWGPAVATSSTAFARGETVLRQARVLGSGQHFHPTNLGHADGMRRAWRDGAGVFIPPSDDARRWARQVLKDRKVEAPAEVKAAVLEDALLGRYGRAPKYADPGDVYGTIRNYVNRDGTWNADASRKIEDKVRSFLERTAGPGTTDGTGAGAEAKA